MKKILGYLLVAPLVLSIVGALGVFVYQAPEASLIVLGLLLVFAAFHFGLTILSDT